MRKRVQQSIILAMSILMLIVVEIRFQTTIQAAMISAGNSNAKAMNEIHNLMLYNPNWHAVGLSIATADSASAVVLHAAAPSDRAVQAAAHSGKEQPASAASKTAAIANTAAAAVRETEPSLYRVTAYYLNVRSGPEASTEILDVVEKDMELETVRLLPNGWHELKNGGYVHGKYVEAVQPAVSEASAAPVTLAAGGAEPVTAVAAAAYAAQPLQKTPAAAAPAELPVLDTLEQMIAAMPPKPDLDPAKPTSKVETESHLSEADIEELFEGTELEGHGIEEAVLEVEEEYGINALFTIAVMKLESGNGKSKLARDKNNLFGLNATGGGNHKAFSFDTKGDSVRKFGQLISKHYIGKGYTTIEKIAKKYCPANPKWAGLVQNIMKRDFKKL